MEKKIKETEDLHDETKNVLNKHFNKKLDKNLDKEQAGAELCQAQDKFSLV